MNDVLAGSLAQAVQVQQIIDALKGTPNKGVPVALVSLNDPNNYALTIQNDDPTNSKALSVLKADGTGLITADANGVTLGSPVNLPVGSITSSMIADGTIGAADLNPALGNFGAAATWSPITTQGGSTPTATITCNRYIKIGRLVFIAAMLNYTAVGSLNQDIIVGNLPVAPASIGSYFAVGSFMYARAGVAVYSGAAVLYATTGLKFAAGGSDGTNNLQGYLGNVSGPNFAIASGDFLSFTAMYESAT